VSVGLNFEANERRFKHSPTLTEAQMILMIITGIVIPATIEQSMTRVEYESEDFRFIQSIVGGTFTVTDLEEDVKASIFSNDEGLLIGLDFNKRATALLYAFSPRHIGYTMLVGTCLIVGYPDEEGVTQSVPPALLALIGV
jgi:hypothetical protein